jgi:putative nucleotidyltransferase with HDIG domain
MSYTGDRKRIDVDELRVGMYCEDVLNEEGVLILSAQIPVSNAEQIAILKRLGVRFVEINIEKGADVSEPATETPAADERHEEHPPATVHFEEELPKAKEIYGKTMQTVRNALNAIRSGETFPGGEIEAIVEEMVGSVFRNRDALMSLAQIKGYDEYTYEHSVHVATYTCSLCHAMGYEKDTIFEAGVGGLLHDIGKTWIPEYIVNKRGRLTDAENSVVRCHPEYGLEIVKDQRGISDLARKIIAEHHERINGKGYPHRLTGNQLHPLGVIAGMADSYDAMTSDRVYCKANTPQESLAEIYKCIGEEYPRFIAENFVKLLGVYPVGSFVRLISGERGIVTRINREEILAPDIVVLFSADGQRLRVPMAYRLSEKMKGIDGESFAIEKALSPRQAGVDVTVYLKETMAF